jgi:hypothetical protein
MSFFTSGVVGVIDGGIGDLETYHNNYIEGDRSLEEHVSFGQSITDLSGEIVGKKGTAAKQIIDDVESPSIQDGEINIRSQKETVWRWTEFWLAFNGDGPDFVLVKKHNSGFPFGLLSDALDQRVKRASFNLEDMIRDYPGQWTGGFGERQAKVQSGLLWGDDIEDDTEMGDPFISSSKNLIGPTIQYRGQKLKTKISSEGFVQIVDPNDYSREAFIAFVEEMVLPYRN